MDVLIDTDPGMGTLGAEPEDSLAIAMALASPELTVRAVTCVQGNVPVRHSYANAAHLLEVLGRNDVPLAAGGEGPLLGERRREQMRWLGERDARSRVIPPAERPYPGLGAVEVILRAARESKGLTVIAIGPLTNVAAALVADPGLARRLDRIVIMGGAFEVPGNITPHAEFNFFMDPEAAQIVLAADAQTVLVGLDVCNRTHLTNAQMPTAGSKTALGRFLQRSCAAWLPQTGDDGPHLYDTLAVASVLSPELLTLEPAVVEIATTFDAMAGASAAWLPERLSAWSRPAAPDDALVATSVDLSAFDALFAERVLAQL